MKIIARFLLLCASLSACASMRASGEFQAGREAFLAGNSKVAAAYFQSVARNEPNYVYGTALQQNIWNYLGRAHYAVGSFADAQTALQKSLLVDQRTPHLAQLYLGLSMARSGDRQQGLNRIESGLKGLHQWLEYVTEAHRFSFGQFWDPRREIRSSIEANLAMLSGREIDWERLLAEGERLGMRMEEEADRARWDERADLDRDGDDRP